MITRIFRAADLFTAIRDIQRTLGPEAVIVSVRSVSGGPLWQAGPAAEVELVAMAAQVLPAAVSAPAPMAPAPAPAAARPAWRWPLRRWWRALLAGLRSTISRQP